MPEKSFGDQATICWDRLPLKEIGTMLLRSQYAAIFCFFVRHHRSGRPSDRKTPPVSFGLPTDATLCGAALAK
jgi:hypothetical protein